jgi:hypothetical protein
MTIMKQASNRSHAEHHNVVGSARIARRASRRLRMESMEGRLMLSTTVTYFTPVDMTPAQISFDADQPVVTVGQFEFSPAFREGGFIVTPFSPTTDSFHSVDFDVVEVIGAPQEFPANPADQPLADSITNNSATINVSTNTDTNFAAGLDAGPSGVLFGNTGLQPAVISSLELKRAAEEIVGPVLTANDVEEASRDEGGPISIAAVLTGVRPLEGLEPHVPAPSQLAVATDEDSPPTVRIAGLPSSVDRQISGELARATVFEIAGGEPAIAAAKSQVDRTDPHAEPRAEVEPEIYRPVSNQGQPIPARDVVPERVSHRATNRPAEFALHGSGPSFGLALHRSIRDDQSTGSLAYLDQVTEPNAVLAGANAANASTLDAAHEEVFERLGETANVAATSAAINLSWRGALNTTPLLMILALERIATSNLRCAIRRDAFVSRQKALGRRRSFEHIHKGS